MWGDMGSNPTQGTKLSFKTFTQSIVSVMYMKYIEGAHVMAMYTGLQITVGHRPLAHQNLLMSDEIPNVIGHDVRTNILSQIILQQR